MQWIASDSEGNLIVFQARDTITALTKKRQLEASALMATRKSPTGRGK